MAYLNFDEHLTTGIRFFDGNNKLLVNGLNILEEKKRNNADIEEIRKFFSSFIEMYRQHSESQIACIGIHNYANTGYMEFLHKKQLEVLNRIKNTLNGTYPKLTQEHIESVKEIIINNISHDKSCAKFFKQKYKDAVDDILA